MPEQELCGCGQPLHYTDPKQERDVKAFIAHLGRRVRVTVRGVTYLVPRHYIALHGIKGQDIEHLAAKYHWEQVE